MNVVARLLLSFYLVLDPSPWDNTIYIQDGLSTLKLSGNALADTPELCLLLGSNPAKLTVKMSHYGHTYLPPLLFLCIT